MKKTNSHISACSTCVSCMTCLAAGTCESVARCVARGGEVAVFAAPVFVRLSPRGRASDFEFARLIAMAIRRAERKVS